MKRPHFLSSIRLLSLGLSTLLSLTAACRHASNQSSAKHSGTKQPYQTIMPVFEAGEGGYKVFRIPAIICCANQDLLAFCEARQGGDASEIDLVLKRSRDNGKTWGNIQVVQESDDFKSLLQGPAAPITIGNPAPVVDLLDPDHRGRVWLPYTFENDRVFVIYSDDHGSSWAPRRDITADVKRDSWGWYATGPVHSIQIQNGLHKGRLVIPGDHRLGEGGQDQGALGAQVVFSDDHGLTWQLGAVDDTYEDDIHANETTVVELKNGVLYFNTRDHQGQAPGTRGETWSFDGGSSFKTKHSEWKAFQPAHEILDPPVVQCSILRLSTGMIVFSGPDENGPSGPGRSDLKLRFSEDEAKSWQDGRLIHLGPAAYSDMIETDDGLLGVLFENGDAGGKNAYERISFARVPIELIRE